MSKLEGIAIFAMIALKRLGFRWAGIDGIHPEVFGQHEYVSLKCFTCWYEQIVPE